MFCSACVWKGKRSEVWAYVILLWRFFYLRWVLKYRKKETRAIGKYVVDRKGDVCKTERENCDKSVVEIVWQLGIWDLARKGYQRRNQRPRAVTAAVVTLPIVSGVNASCVLSSAVETEFSRLFLSPLMEHDTWNGVSKRCVLFFENIITLHFGEGGTGTSI